jgi:hypothetical protein
VNNPAEERSVSRTRRPPLRWFHKTEGATFGEFVRRYGGATHFGNRMKQDGRFRDRCWPALAPTKRRREAKLRFHMLFMRKSKQIDRSADIAAAKRWLCCNPLFVRQMFVEDTVRERKRGKR